MYHVKNPKKLNAALHTCIVHFDYLVLSFDMIINNLDKPSICLKEKNNLIQGFLELKIALRRAIREGKKYDLINT